jgi:alkylation response protein AidB-like acyl-CoA dehydrogenase
MQFGLSESQRILQSNARKFFAAECPISEVRRILETDTAQDQKLWRSMAEQGFLGVVFPEDAGGMGLGFVELAALAEEMGRALVPGAFLSNLFAGAILEASGATKHLAAIAGGEKTATVALLETSASWNPDAVKMPTLAGEKLFVPDAASADYIVVAARDANALALYLVESSHVAKTLMPAMDLTRRLYKVTFDHPAAELLAKGADARKALDLALNVVTVALCAEMTGGMQRMLDIAVDYAKTRKQFGKPIGQYQAVQHQCADMLLFTESARSAAYYAAYTMRRRTRATRAGKPGIARCRCRAAWGSPGRTTRIFSTGERRRVKWRSATRRIIGNESRSSSLGEAAANGGKLKMRCGVFSATGPATRIRSFYCRPRWRIRINRFPVCIAWAC